MIFTAIPSYLKDTSRGNLSRDLVECLIRNDRSLEDWLNGFPLNGVEHRISEADLINVVQFHQEQDVITCPPVHSWDELKKVPLRLTSTGRLKYDEDSIEHPA